jgi:hypothetical protein
VPIGPIRHGDDLALTGRGNQHAASANCREVSEQDSALCRKPALYRVRAALLIVIAAALALSHLGHLDPRNLQPAPRTILGSSPVLYRYRRRPDRRCWR